MKGNFFELDNELSDMLVKTHYALGFLRGMIKYAPNEELFMNLCLLLECCYSRMIDYAHLSFYSALVGDGVDCTTHIASAYKYFIGKEVTAPV